MSLICVQKKLKQFYLNLKPLSIRLLCPRVRWVALLGHFFNPTVLPKKKRNSYQNIKVGLKLTSERNSL